MSGGRNNGSYRGRGSNYNNYNRTLRQYHDQTPRPSRNQVFDDKITRDEGVRLNLEARNAETARKLEMRFDKNGNQIFSTQFNSKSDVKKRMKARREAHKSEPDPFFNDSPPPTLSPAPDDWSLDPTSVGAASSHADPWSATVVGPISNTVSSSVAPLRGDSESEDQVLDRSPACASSPLHNVSSWNNSGTTTGHDGSPDMRSLDYDGGTKSTETASSALSHSGTIVFSPRKGGGYNGVCNGSTAEILAAADAPAPELSTAEILAAADAPAPELSTAEILAAADAPAPELSTAETLAATDAPAPELSTAETLAATDAPAPELSTAETLAATDAPAPELSTAETLAATDAPAPELSTAETLAATDAPAPELSTAETLAKPPPAIFDASVAVSQVFKELLTLSASLQSKLGVINEAALQNNVDALGEQQKQFVQLAKRNGDLKRELESTLLVIASANTTIETRTAELNGINQDIHNSQVALRDKQQDLHNLTALVAAKQVEKQAIDENLSQKSAEVDVAGDKLIHLTEAVVEKESVLSRLTRETESTVDQLQLLRSHLAAQDELRLEYSKEEELYYQEQLAKVQERGKRRADAVANLEVQYANKRQRVD